MAGALKHAMGVLGTLLAVWGCGLVYTALTAPYAVWWDQGAVGVALLLGALAIYRRWFR